MKAFLTSVLVFTWLSLPSLSHADPAAPASSPLPSLTRKTKSFSILERGSGFVHASEADLEKVEFIKLKPAEIISMAGRGTSDLWFLTEDQKVIHDDGKKVVERFVKPCGWGDYDRESNGVGTHFYRIAADKNEVHVIAQYRDMNTRIGAERRASLGADGKWVCKAESLVPDLMQSTPAMTFRASHNMDGDACRISSLLGFCTSGPRFAASHVDPSRDSTDMGIYNTAFYMLGLDDGWTVTLEEHFAGVLHRFNGVTWAPIAKIGEGLYVKSIWVDETRSPWLLARDREKWDNPGKVVLRYDGKALQEMPVPTDFAAMWVDGTGSKDVWFGGKDGAIYQWDGSKWHQETLPFEPASHWVAPGGEVYLVSPVGIVVTAPFSEAR